MKKSTITILIALSLLVTGFILGAHPLVDHFGETAQSGTGTFGSQWIHTDTSGTRYGLWGVSDSTTGRGVFGNASATSGDARGVFGQSASTSGVGVLGNNTASSGTANGVRGISNSTSGHGVFGNATASTGDARGVVGNSVSPAGLGVYGSNQCTSGSCNGVGVFGSNYESTGTGKGIYGRNNANNGWAGYFDSSDGHGVLVTSPSGSTGLIVYGGSKSAAVKTSSGDRLLYNEESTEIWFTDYGSSTLKDGVALVAIDEIFAETANLDEPYHVFLQAYGDVTIYVGERAPTYFEVFAKEDSSFTDIEFSYRIVAKRRGFESHRLELAPWVSEEEPYLMIPTPPPPPIEPTIP